VRLTKQRVSVVLLGLALTCVGLAQGKITGVTSSSTQGSLRIDIQGDNLTKPKQSTISNGTLHIFEFANTTLAKRGGYLSLKSNGVKGVTYVQFSIKPLVARVTVRTTQPGVPPTLAQVSSGWSVTLSGESGVNGAEPALTAPKLQPGMLLEASGATASASAKQANGNPSTSSMSSTPSLSGMPNITSVSPMSSSPAKPAPKPTPTPAPSKPIMKPINLDFVGADIVFILKALAAQTGVNIVTAPDVHGSLTVSLKGVSVEQALDLTSKLAGYRYTKINNTWVVGTGDFLTRMLFVSEGGEPTNPGGMMKVVPLASRKAGEIKRAIVKALSIDQLNESLRIVHPASQDENGPTAAAAPAAGATPGTAAGTTGTGVAQEGDADYLILIGYKDRVDQAQLLISQLDEALAEMNGVGSGGVGMVPITVPYEVHGGKAEELAKAISAVAGGVKVAATPGTSRAGQTIVLHGRPAEVTKLIGIIESIDNVAMGGELTYAVYDVKYADPRALCDQLKSSFETLAVTVGPQSVTGRSYKPAGAAGAASMTAGSTPGGTSGSASASGSSSTSSGTGAGSTGNLNANPMFASMEADAVPMKLVLSGAKNVVESAIGMLLSLDKPAPQVAIEARVVEMSKEDILKAGFSWDILTGGALTFLKFDNSQPSPSNSGGLDITGSNFSASLTGSLDKLINKNNVIARPNVTAIDGREAVVFVGDVVRYIKNLQSSQNGTTVEIGEEEVGVKLNVLARVGEDKTITMDVQPTVSFIKDFVPTGNGGKVPTTSVRTVRNTIRVKNGETIAIGGLISEEDRKNISGLPILMDLPIIGNLFKSTTHTKAKTEIVIFITARVIDGDALGTGGGKK
jgi:type II secretory pathway component GspD/PulD (secretin)